MTKLDFDSVEVKLFILLFKHFIYNDAQDKIDKVLENNQIQWSELLEFAQKHSVLLPLVHIFTFNKSIDIPTNISKQIQSIRHFFTTRNKNLTRELLRVSNAFQKNGIEIYPYKGFAFAKQFYGNIFQRTSVDIDFALGTEYFMQAKTIMESLGYEEIKGNLNEEDVIEKSRAYYLDYPFVLRKDGKILFNVEFHWTPSHHILDIPISFSEFENNIGTIQFGQHIIDTYDRVSQGLFAVIHHGNVDCWGKFKHLVDFGLMMNKLSEKEIRELELLCKKYKVYKSYLKGQALLFKFFGDARFKHLKISKRWENDILEGKLKGNWSENRMKFVYFISSRDNFLEKIKSAFSIIKYQFYTKKKLGIN